METTKIAVKTTVHAPIKKVWSYWSDPQHVVNWNNASPDWHTPNAENDLREGGSFTYTMAAKDGSMRFDFGGEYTKIVDHRQINYKMEDGREVENLFDANGNSVDITVTFDAETKNPVEMQRGGWQAILDNFKAYLEAN